MNDSLPKPTSPQPAGNDQNTDQGKTVFQNDQQQDQAPPQGQQPKQQQVNLAGKDIPVPTPKQPQAAGGDSQPKPVANVNTGHHEMGINPALAPKPLEPKTEEGATQEPAGKPNMKDAGQAGKPGQPPQAQTPTAPKLAGVKKPFFAQLRENPRRWLLMGLGAIVGLGLLIWLLTSIFGGGSDQSSEPTGNTGAPARQVVLTYWGLWEPTAVLEEVIADYEAQRPGVSIDYRVQSHRDYRERLQTAIASGNGPDIFRYHAAWVPMLADELAVMPASVMSANEFQASFYPVAAQQLQIEGAIVGLPLMYDGLVLYYNTEILQTAGVEPPTTWSELKQLASELSVPADVDERRNGNIQRSGLAIGNATNVDHFADVLALLILQNGGDPGEPAFTEVRDALVFYTNFVAEDAVWNSNLPSSTVAFARGEAAMMLAPSWRAHEILALNPDLQFDTAPLPQLSEEQVSWANYWAEGVNDLSENKTEAWNFLKYLTSADVMKKLYSSQSQVRAFGEPYSRQDIGSELLDQPYVGAILQDAPIATGWHMSSATHDNGLNDNIIEYYAAAVRAVLAGDDIDDVLLSLESGVKQELRQYSIE